MNLINELITVVNIDIMLTVNYFSIFIILPLALLRRGSKEKNVTPLKIVELLLDLNL